MIRREFVEKVFTLFRKKAENNEELVRVYDEALSTKKAVDWDKLYKLTVMEAETTYLPMPQWFTSKFDMCLKDTNYATEDGLKVHIYVKDKKHTEGYPYDFETYRNTLSFEELKQKAMNKWKEQFLSMQIFDEDSEQWVKV